MIYHQANMQVHEDLAALFSKNLTLDSAPIPSREPEEQPSKLGYSISQHYHHSAHVVRQDPDPAQPPLQRPASEPPQLEYPTADAILASHGIDHSVLSSSQLELFKTADDFQKVRLIQLWQISPPTNSIDNPALAWSSTTLEQEEMLAQKRFEEKELREQAASSAAMSLDGTPVPVPFQAGDGRWLPQSYMEPYMVSGYEELARRDYPQSSLGPRPYRPATDPVFKTTNNGGDPHQHHQQAMEMENSYGAFVAMRDSDMEL